MRWRRAALVAEVLAISVVGATLGLVVGAQTTREVGPFDAHLSLRPSLSPRTVLQVPPLGEVLLRTHRSPVDLVARVVVLREAPARRLAQDPERLRDLGDEVAADLRRSVTELLVRAALVTAAGSLVLGLLVFRRDLRRVAVCGGVGVALVAGLSGATAATVDRSAIREPQVRGLLSLAPAVVGDIGEIGDRFDQYGAQLGRLVTNVSALYSTTTTLPAFAAGAGSVRLLHVSDLHLSPTAFEVVAGVVDQFDVHAVVDTGDLTDRGSAAENGYASGITALGVPYLYVRGNHDSATTERAVALQRNAVLLRPDRPATVEGLVVLGAPDPRFTPDKRTGDDDAPRDALEAVGRDLLAAARGLPQPPAVVAVHDPLSAEPLLGEVPLVLAGHRHERDVEVREGTTVMVQGSTGGAGLRALEAAEPEPVELTLLHLSAAGVLQAYDEITLGGLGRTEARIRRVVVRAPAPAATPTVTTRP